MEKALTIEQIRWFVHEKEWQNAERLRVHTAFALHERVNTRIAPARRPIHP